MARITCLLQGLTDHPLDDLGGLTPLQKAKHPALDALAASGTVHDAQGVDALALSETALLSLFGVEYGAEGVEPSSVVPIAPLEAAALGYTLAPNQVAFSVRFVSMGQEVIIDAADELLSDNEGRLFCELLNDCLAEHKVHFAHLHGPRAVAITSHPAFVESVKLASPHPIEALGQLWQTALPGGKENTALASVLDGAIDRLSNHEVNLLRDELEEPLVNGILLSDGGHRPSWSQPKQRCDFSDWLLYTTRPAFVGLARAIGMEVLQLDPEPKKFSHVPIVLDKLPALAAEKRNVVLDIPYLRNSTYKGDLLEKIKTIEWIDRNVLAPLLAFCQADSHSLIITTLTHADIRAGTTIAGVTPAITWDPEKKLATDPSPFWEGDLSDAPKLALNALIEPVPVA